MDSSAEPWSVITWFQAQGCIARLCAALSAANRRQVTAGSVGEAVWCWVPNVTSEPWEGGKRGPLARNGGAYAVLPVTVWQISLA